MTGPERRQSVDAHASRPTPGDVLAWLASLGRAIAARDGRAVDVLLGERVAGLAPRAVHEEALALCRASPDSMRAPLALLQFAHRVRQLARTGEPMPGATGSAERDAAGNDPGQLELPWRGGGAWAPVRARAHRPWEPG